MSHQHAKGSSSQMMWHPSGRHRYLGRRVKYFTNREMWFVLAMVNVRSKVMILIHLKVYWAGRQSKILINFIAGLS